ADINDYLREVTGCQISAKDFRTWHATVLAALTLSGAAHSSVTARKRAVTAAMREVSEYLGNTPAVARASYVDPRVVDLYHEGVTVDLPSTDGTPREQAERAVLRLLDGETLRSR